MFVYIETWHWNLEMSIILTPVLKFTLYPKCNQNYYTQRLFLSFECNEQGELDLISVLSIPSPVLKKMIFSLILLCNYLFYVANFRKQPRDCFQEFCWHRHQGSKRKSNLSSVFRASWKPAKWLSPWRVTWRHSCVRLPPRR